MNFATKLIISAITIGFTVFGGIYTAFEKNDSRMDSKVAKSEKEIYSEISDLKIERKELMQAQDDKFKAEVGGLKGQLISMDNKLNILIGLNKRREVVKWNSETMPTMSTIRRTPTHILKNTN